MAGFLWVAVFVGLMVYAMRQPQGKRVGWVVGAVSWFLFYPILIASKNAALTASRPAATSKVGSLRILVKPPDARVTVQGPNKYYRKVTGSNKFGNLSAGKYTVTVSKPGYNTLVRDYTIAGNNFEEFFHIKTDAEINAERRAAQERAERERAEARRRELEAEPDPTQAEIVVQTTPDNYGIELYMILTDYTGEQIAVTGKARVKLTVKGYGTYGEYETNVFDETYEVYAEGFTPGTRGLGAFKRDALFYKLGRIDTSNISGEYGNAYLTFTDSQGRIVKAKDFVSYP